MPTRGINASQIHVIIWECVQELMSWGFNVDFIMQDGAEENRKFIKSHFSDHPRCFKYTLPNLVNPARTVIMVQDYSHVKKKGRNSFLNSGSIPALHTRLMTKDGLPIV